MTGILDLWTAGHFDFAHAAVLAAMPSAFERELDARLACDIALAIARKDIRGERRWRDHLAEGLDRWTITTKERPT